MGQYRQYYFDLNPTVNKCEICGKRMIKSKLSIHHLYGYDGLRDSVRNLVAVCQACHTSIHRGYDGYEGITRKLDQTLTEEGVA